MRALPALILALAACNGNDGDDGSTPGAGGCEDIGTSPLNQVEAPLWPAGTSEAITDYLSVAGRWEATSSCGDLSAFKITIQNEEMLEIVQEPWPTSRNCGCLTDPNFEPDSKYDLIALHDNFQFFIETFDDPGVMGQTVQGAGALFGPGEALRFRGCGTQNIDPAANSAFDQLTTILRIEQGGAITGDIVLSTDEGDTTVCALTGWTLVATR